MHSTLRRSTRFSLVALSGLFFLTAPAIAQVVCSSALTGSAYPGPGYFTVQPQVGWDLNTWTYNGTSRPRDIPLGVTLSDTDEAIALCADYCRRIQLTGDWTANWSALNSDGLNPGGFLVFANGFEVPTLSDATLVHYQPPDDLALDEARTITVRAEIVDVYPLTPFADAGGTFDFPIVVHHLPDGSWNLSVFGPERYFTPEVQLPCDDDPSLSRCELLSGVDPATPPVGSMHHMVLLTQRPTFALSATGQDFDKLVIECGTPPGFTPPSHTGQEIIFGDKMNYAWSFAEGGGTFLVQGKSTIVTVQNWITPPVGRKYVRIRVLISDSSGETPVEAISTITKHYLW
jgi:hypothetical protein